MMDPGLAHGASRSVLAVDGDSGGRNGAAVGDVSSKAKTSAVLLWKKTKAVQGETSSRTPRSRFAICVHAEDYRLFFDDG